jgi:lipopolysaccharide export system protein LptC
MSASQASFSNRIQQFIYEFAVRFLPLFIMGGLALMSYWLLKINMVEEAPITPKIKTHAPDYSFQNIKITALNEIGQTKYRLIGSSMIHFEDDSSIDIEQPKLRFFPPNSPPLTIFGDSGHLNGDLSILELFKRAEIFRPPEISSSNIVINPMLRARSDYFKVLINDDVIKTNLPVKLERGESVVTASQGLEFDNIQQRTILFGDVKGFLIPNQKAK